MSSDEGVEPETIGDIGGDSDKSDLLNDTNLQNLGAEQTTVASSGDDSNEPDLFRDTNLRYLGYANEVGEAFRAIVPLSWVRFSYAIAINYVGMDSIHKGYAAYRYPWNVSNEERWTNVGKAVVDTMIWQGLASVAIPGFTINRICWFTHALLRRNRFLPKIVRSGIATSVGLAAIPYIIKPIDRGVDFFMEATVRPYMEENQEMEEKIVKHQRDD